MNVQDHLAREQAIHPGLSFAVAAPAGSGKTGLLTQRVLKLLALCEHPEEVLSITFTRKAAAEMQHRIHQAIVFAQKTNSEPDNPHDALTWQLAKKVLQQDNKHNWQLLSNPNRIRVQTIDGFCRNLARQLPLASGLGALPETLDEPQQAYQQAVQSVFSQIEKDDVLHFHWRRALQHLDNQLPQLQELMTSLLAKRDQWLHTLLPLYFDAKALAEQEINTQTTGDSELGLTSTSTVQPPSHDSEPLLSFNHHSLKNWIEESLNKLADAIGFEASELSMLADYAASNLASEGKTDLSCLCGLKSLPGTSPEELRAWQQLSHLLLSQTGWRKQLNKNIGFVSPKDKSEKHIADGKKTAFKELLGRLSDIDGLEEELRLLRLLPELDANKSLEAMLLSLSYLMVVIAAELKLVFRRLGASDFIEVSQAALQALGNDEQPTDIALQLDYQIRHILVDEFQDTAQPQLQLLEKLTAGWEADDGRTLFIVGDGMQSCYGFRDANVGIFLQARRQGIGTVPLKALDLCVNFRSQTDVVEWVNRVFVNAFPSKDDIGRGAVSYNHSTAFKDSLDGPACQTHIVSYNDRQDKEQAREQQAQHIACAIAKLREEQPSDSIAVLVRNRPHLNAVLQALEKHDLKWQATDIDPLASRIAIEDLINLTRCMLYPSDRLAWLGLMRSPLLGFNLQELWSLCNWSEDVDERERISDGFGRPAIISALLNSCKSDYLKPASQLRLQEFIEHFSAAQLNKGRKPLRQWVEGFWLSVGGPACLLEHGDIENARSFFTLLEAEGWQIKEWQSFRNKVDRLFARPAADSDPHIQVMTIHKSKGLEFDHVFIPELDRRPRSNDNELFLWQQRINQYGESDLLMAPLASRAFNDHLSEEALEQQNGLYRLLREEDKLKTEYEATRLLYVACTRAIKRLHLFAALAIDEKAQAKAEIDDHNIKLKAPSSSSLLGKIWPTVQHELNIYPLDNSTTQSLDTENTDRHPSEDFNLQLDHRWQAPDFPELDLLAAYRGREFADDDNTPESYNVEQLFYRHLGTVLHRCLQHIGEEGLDQWNAQRQDEARHFWRLQLQQLGLWASACEHACQLIGKALDLTLGHVEGRWILDKQHQDSHFEWRLWDANANREYIIDRCFVADGKRWLIDYKSSLPKPGQTEDEFFAEEQSNYQDQLNQYQKLLNTLGDEPVQRALYFPLLQKLLLID